MKGNTRRRIEVGKEYSLEREDLEEGHLTIPSGERRVTKVMSRLHRTVPTKRILSHTPQKARERSLAVKVCLLTR